MPTGDPTAAVSPGVVWHDGAVSRDERAAVTGGRGDLAAFYGDGITRDTPAAVRAVSAFVAARRAEAEALRQLDLHVEGRAAAAAAA